MSDSDSDCVDRIDSHQRPRSFVFFVCMSVGLVLSCVVSFFHNRWVILTITYIYIYIYLYLFIFPSNHPFDRLLKQHYIHT